MIKNKKAFVDAVVEIVEKEFYLTVLEVTDTVVRIGPLYNFREPGLLVDIDVSTGKLKFVIETESLLDLLNVVNTSGLQSEIETLESNIHNLALTIDMEF